MDAQQEAKTIYILHFRVGAHCRAKRGEAYLRSLPPSFGKLPGRAHSTV